MVPTDLRPKDRMTVNRTRRTNKYDAMDDASYEALMNKRGIYPYLMEWEVSGETEDVGVDPLPFLGCTEFEAMHMAIPGD